SSERVPGRAFGEFQIADIGAEPRADPGRDRHHIDAVVDERRHAKAADEIGRAIEAAIACDRSPFQMSLGCRVKTRPELSKSFVIFDLCSPSQTLSADLCHLPPIAPKCSS